MKSVGFTFNVSYIVLFLVFSPPTLSYEVRTHEALTAEAIKNSLYKIDISHTLGLTLGQQLPDPILMNCIGSVSDPQNDDCDYLGQRGKGSYVGLILNGSSYEDLEYTPWYLRSLSHFYDPVNDRGLTPEGYVGTAVFGVKKIISFILTYSMYSYLIPPSLNLDGTAFGYKNPDWAFNNLLPDSQKVMIKIPQFYSYPDAYTYLYLALTSKNDSDRDKYFGKAFQALGQVSHLLQDMAAIEHVRNDAHLPCCHQ